MLIAVETTNAAQMDVAKFVYRPNHMTVVNKNTPHHRRHLNNIQNLKSPKSQPQSLSKRKQKRNLMSSNPKVMLQLYVVTLLGKFDPKIRYYMDWWNVLL